MIETGIVGSESSVVTSSQFLLLSLCFSDASEVDEILSDDSLSPEMSPALALEDAGSSSSTFFPTSHLSHFTSSTSSLCDSSPSVLSSSMSSAEDSPSSSSSLAAHFVQFASFSEQSQRASPQTISRASTLRCFAAGHGQVAVAASTPSALTGCPSQHSSPAAGTRACFKVSQHNPHGAVLMVSNGKTLGQYTSMFVD